MKALEFRNNKLVLTELAIPEPPKGEALIKVSKVGICNTDIEITKGYMGFEGVLGHEFVGTVEKINSNDQTLLGKRVVGEINCGCGECESCRKGLERHCTNRTVLGIFGRNGCFAEYMYMPEHHVYHMPDNISYDEAALIEPASIAYDAFRNVSFTKDSTVAVVGTGAIGMISVWLAKYLGAGNVIMVGRRDKKLEIAKMVGADTVVNSQKTDSCSALKEMTAGKGVDMIIETSGSAAALMDSIYSVKKDGCISVISFYEKNLEDFPIDYLVLHCINLRGAAGRFGNPSAVCDIISKNPVKLTPVITHRVKFDDCLDFIKNIEKYNTGKIKVMVEF
ncbi:MAG: alcohol dehydrogenase catalytic domain-containing protein [Bacillota bacterium]|nr:alcohol dehydrogenase catalytic domain-containing protein [Bacillota bacterium]